MVREFEMHGPLSRHAPAYAGTGRLQSALAGMLAQANGAAAYAGAFVLLPSGACDACWSMEELNAGSWKEAYPQAVRSVWFFAVDVMGYPYGIGDECVVQLAPDTGELTRIAGTMGGFLSALEGDPDGMAGYGLLESWFASGNGLDLRRRLVPKIPFLLGGGGGGPDAFYAEDLMQVLDLGAYLYGQTKDLPEGARVELRVVD